MIVTIILLIAAIGYLLLILPTQWLKVERVKYPCGLGIRALQISDIHVEKLRISAAALNRLIRKEQPDYVFLTGDYTQEPQYLTKVQHYLQAISSAGIPVYAVLGNHDHRLPPADMNRLVRIFQDQGVVLLSNRSVSAAGFQLVGIDDFCSNKSRIDKAFEHVDPSKPVLVLTHDPNLTLHLKRKYTYLMAGHFHGMQFNVPFLFRFINKGKLPAAGVYKGLHSGSYGAFYISKGIGQSGPNARLFVRSEVTLHELQ